MDREQGRDLSSWVSILGVAGPAILQCVAAPLTTTLQTAWLGLHSPASLAAFATVSSVVTFAVKIFIFFTDGVAAKVGGAYGQHDHRTLIKTVTLSLTWSVAIGLTACALLLALEPLCLRHLFVMEPRVLRLMAGYWAVRAGAVPFGMANMACAGILQGLNHVPLCAALNTGQAVAEAALSAGVLLGGWRLAGTSALSSLGWVTLGTQAALLAASLAAVCACMPGGVRSMLRGAMSEDLDSGWHSLNSVTGHAEATADGRLAGCGSPRSPTMDLLAGDGTATLGLPLLAGQALEEKHDLDEESPCQADESPVQAQGTDGVSSLAPGAGTTRSSSNSQTLPHTRRAKSTSVAFFGDGLNMLLRSVTLQATFLLALAAAVRLGTAAVAAHTVIVQLWMLSAYAVDGFAAAGIVLGSQLAGAAAVPGQADASLKSLRRIIQRCCGAGLVFGAVTGVVYLAMHHSVVSMFTKDTTVATLLSGPVWYLLAVMQPINGLVFVLDGLMYASHNFAYVRDYMAIGFAVVFCPALILQLVLFPGLLGIWAAKAVYNLWRMAGGLNLVLVRFLKEVEERAALAAARRGPEPRLSGEAPQSGA